MNQLIGMIVQFDADDDGELYMLSRIDSHLGGDYFLMRRISPHTYLDLLSMHVLSLYDFKHSNLYGDIDSCRKRLNDATDK